jgi:pimeloyl-ACP methyl ester carboxylesterase
MTITHDACIDYDVYGNGPPLLLISGLGFGRWGWFKQVPTLSRHFRTITFDIRGEQGLAHGVADLCAEVVALLDHLGVEKTHVLGTSLGGFVAQELALERPDLVDRLVLVCTSYGGVGREPVSPAALGRMFGWGSLSPEDAARRGLEGATSEVYRAEHPEEFDLILRWRLADSPSLSEYYRQAAAGARFNASATVRNISCPTLVIHGSQDRYVPVANAAALAEAIPDSRLRVIEDAGHLVFIEQAKEVNEEITSFLKPRRMKLSRIPTRQMAGRLVERAREASQRLISTFEPRAPQGTDETREERAERDPSRETEERPALGAFKGWLRRARTDAGAWIRKLRGRLSR